MGDVIYFVGMFGSLRVYRAGEETPFLTKFATKKTASLLAYMAFHAGRIHPRSTLAEMLWPDTSNSLGLQSLSQSLGILRKELKVPGVPLDDVLETTNDTAGLTRAFSTDVALYVSLLKEARQIAATSPDRAATMYRQAVTMYKAGFLPGYYEDWVVATQQELGIAYEETHAWLAHHNLVTRTSLVAAGTAALVATPATAPKLPKTAGLQTVSAPKRSARSGKRDDSGKVAGGVGEIPAPPDPVEPAETVASLPPTPMPDFPFLSGVPPEGVPQPPIPTPRTQLFGRREEVSWILDHLKTGNAAVVTLTGVGGVGKTRLAREVLQNLRDDAAPARSVFVDLSQVTTATEMTAAILTALGKPATATGDAALAQISSALAQIPYPILLLDNFDHLVAEGAAWLQSLLLGLRELKVLVTSRSRLWIEGEQVIPVSPLPVPSLEESASPEAVDTLMDRWPALQMYQYRARLAAPSFHISPKTVGDIMRLLNRLEGIPLAIELAAARARVMGTSLMLEQLTANRFELLRHRGHKVEERHRSLRDTIAWSVELLPDDVRLTFGQISVFQGSFSLTAAIAVTGQTVLDITVQLEQLADASLLIVEEVTETPEGKTEPRFRLLDTIREYARELLESQTAAEIERRHAQHYFNFAKGAERHLFRAEQEKWFRYMRGEYSNIRTALDWYAKQPDEFQAENLVFCSSLGRFWYVSGPLVEGRRYLEQAIQQAKRLVSPQQLITALINASAMALEMQDARIARRFLRQVGWFTRPGGPAAGDRRRAMMLHNLADVEANAGRYSRAQELIKEAIDFWQKENRPFQLPQAWGNLGGLAILAGDWAEAEWALNTSLSLANELHDKRSAGIALSYLADLARLQGQLFDAKRLYRKSLAELLTVEDDYCSAFSLLGLAFTTQDMGDSTLAAWLGAVVANVAATLHVVFPKQTEQRRALLPPPVSSGPIPGLNFRAAITYVIEETEPGE